MSTRPLAASSGEDEDELVGNAFSEVVPGDGCLPSLDQVYRIGEAETHTEPEPSNGHTFYWSYAMGRFSVRMNARWESCSR